MGNCGPPEGEGIDAPGNKITHLPIIINLNQMYLMNNGKNGSIDKFVAKVNRNSEGNITGFGILPLSFDNLIETIAHEIAHAVQQVKNIDHPVIEERGEERSVLLTQCESSGEGERDPNNPLKLIKPKYPE